VEARVVTSLLLPEGSVLLHIGPQKTGSTAIQMAMHLGRDELAQHGVHYAGAKHTPREAGWAVLGKGSAVGRPAARARAWEDLVAEIRDSPLPRVCLSNEDFALADDAAAGRIVDGTGPERTHLVFVARRVDKLLPSHWQERVKARLTLSYEDFLDQSLRPGADDWETGLLWGPQDVTATVERWSQYVDRDRISVIVADEDDRTVLPRAFESMLGLPVGTLVPPRERSNSSLSYPATEVLRRINRLGYDEDWTSTEYWRLVQAGVVQRLKERVDADQPRLRGIPAKFFDQVAERGDQQITALLSAGVQVIGDPERLRIRDRVEPVEPPSPVETIPLDLLADVVSGVRRGAEKLRRAEQRAATRASRREVRDPSNRQLLSLIGRRIRRRMRVAGS
jgi:hypothetical protein